MAIEEQYAADAEAIMSHRHDNGWDYWTTPDKRLMKGGALSAIESALLLLELGLHPVDPLLITVTQMIFDTWQDDGRFKLYPKGAIYPCQTIHAAGALCRLGHAQDPRLQKSFQHLLGTQHHDGGWRCNKFSYGRGPETESSNPGPTLGALNAFRFTDLNREPALEKAVEFLLLHWTTKLPLGPCHYGIGTLFMQVEFPFGNYNLFSFVHVLSFYDKAKTDPRFREALAVLESKLRNGKIVVERVPRSLAELRFCRKGEPSELATRRYHEIRRNLA